MSRRLYFDINCKTGKTKTREPMVPIAIEALLDDLDYYRVHAALVESQNARDYSFIKGNRELLAAAQDQPRLFASAVVSPTARFELSEGEGYYRQLVEKGARAFSVKPKSLVHSLKPLVMEPLCHFMMERRIPMIIDAMELDHLDDLALLLEAYPQLKIALLTGKWSLNRTLFPMLEKFGNLSIDFSADQSTDIPLLFKRFFGIDRLMYGSAFPQRSMGALKAMIEYSRVSEDEKSMVACGNALAFLGLEASAIAPFDTPSRLDALAETMERGEPLKDVFIFDAHAHMMDAKDQVPNFAMMFETDGDSVIRHMDKLGVNQALISPIEGLTTDGMAGNETVYQASLSHPGRILPYACANPQYQSDIQGVVEVYHKQHGFRGLKPYQVYHLLPYTDKAYEPWFEYANEHRLFMLIHSGEPHICGEIRELSARYPEITFLMGHSGISFRVARWNAALAKERPNVVCELNFTNLTREVVEFLVAEVGADRVLFGTDMPLRDPAPQMAWVVYAKLSVEDKKKILGGNMLRIYNRCKPQNTAASDAEGVK